MTTLLVTENFPPKVGGSGRWLWEVYRRLPRQEFAVAAGSDPHEGAFDATHDLRLERLDLSFPTRFLRPVSLGPYRAAFRGLRSLVRREGATMLHCGRCVPEGLLGLALRWRTGVPYACFAHGEEVNLSNAEPKPSWHARRVYGSRELGLLVGRVLRGARFVVANSRNTQAILTERWGLPRERVPLLHPGVDTYRFQPAPPDPEVRAALGWGGRPVVLTVGRLQKRKGHDVMIDALAGVRERVPEVLYAIVGEGEERRSLERRAEEGGLRDHVMFLSEVDDETLIQCYQQCDLFVLPNREIDGDIEGFGMVLLEAQACAKPVLAGDSGGTAETMRIPETGRVVPCDGPDELVPRVVELLVDKGSRLRMGEAARRWVVERFDWEALARRAAEIFAQGAEGVR